MGSIMVTKATKIEKTFGNSASQKMPKIHINNHK